jgi:hypothetical protein
MVFGVPGDGFWGWFWGPSTKNIKATTLGPKTPKPTPNPTPTPKFHIRFVFKPIFK